MTSIDLSNVLKANGVVLGFSVPLTYDSSYAQPSRNWLLRDFYPWFQSKLFDQGLSYKRKHDCDNFARKFCVYAQDAHALTTGNADEGLAVGEFLYISEKVGPHAIVFAIIENQEMIFIEPQNGQIMKLTKGEIESCFTIIV